MGHTASKERQLFIDIIKHMLSVRGIKVTNNQLANFFSFIQEQCPWFPEEGTVNLETWIKIGDQLKTYYTLHGPEKVPVDTFALWNLIRDVLDPVQERNKIPFTPPPGETTPLLPSKTSDKVLAAAFSQKCALKANNNDDDDILPPEDQAFLDEAAATYQRDQDPWGFPVVDRLPPPIDPKELPPPPKPIYPSLTQFRHELPLRPTPPPNKLEDTYHHKPQFPSRRAPSKEDPELAACFPVVFEGEIDDEVNWEPLAYKIIKELKVACADYGPLAPYTLTLLDTLANRWMTIYDWTQVARACLSGGQYLLWRTEYEDLTKKQTAINKKRKPHITLDMLIGTGDYDTAQSQMYLEKEYYCK
eukprot:XP_028343201.1 endogenous retrovirus group K member 5 Gag polyprotein-like [Physeter catodon]